MGYRTMLLVGAATLVPAAVAMAIAYAKAPVNVNRTRLTKHEKPSETRQPLWRLGLRELTHSRLLMLIFFMVAINQILYAA